MSIDQSGLAPGSAGTPTGTSTGASTSTGSGGGGSPSDKAMAALDQTGEVAAGAASAAKNVASETKQHASEVLGQAKDQFHTIVGQTRTEVRDQLGSKAGQAAGSLRTFSEQLTALQNGRPEQASQITGYLTEAQQKVSMLADRLDTEGIQGVMDDVTRFARRKPGLFLLGAVTVGFAVGRTMRAGVAASHEQQEQNEQNELSSSYGSPSYASSYGTASVADTFATVPAESVPGSFAAPSGASTSPLIETPSVPLDPTGPLGSTTP